MGVLSRLFRQPGRGLGLKDNRLGAGSVGQKTKPDKPVEYGLEAAANICGPAVCCSVT